MTRSLLVVDDEADMNALLQRSLEPELNCRVDTATSGEAALTMLSDNDYDLILADIRMPGMDGMALLEEIKRQRPAQTVVMMTAYGQIETAVEAMKHGAHDFITKPFEHDTLVVRLEKALEHTRLVRENQRLQRACGENDIFQDMVGNSAVMKGVFETIHTVAQTDLTVLITGESGVGKDLTAHAVHALSPRGKGPFVAVNCPTVPEHILESELFGYRKGAFTHATQNKIGLFQEAHNGTIFLDEIGDISPTIQTKLLRVLQDKMIKPLGDTKSVSVDVRIVASTNQDLPGKIRTGAFREDFFYRLNVLPIRLPALREHPQDIPVIAAHLLKKHCEKLDKPLKRLSTELREAFLHRSWVGNIREMENVILRGILFSEGDEIHLADAGLEAEEKEAIPTPLPAGGTVTDLPYRDAKEKILADFNHTYLDQRLRHFQGNVTRAARDCGLERQALQQIMRRYRIDAGKYRK